MSLSTKIRGLLSGCFLRGVVCAVMFVISMEGSYAASKALIVVGNTGDETDLEHFSRLANNANSAFLKRGFSEVDIKIIATETTREKLLASLHELKQQLAADDEFWLLLFGHAGRGIDGNPTFQVKGPRVTAADLQSGLESLNSKKYILIATDKSGAFLPLLKFQNGLVLAATAGHGEINQPRFAEKWVEAFVEYPTAFFPQLAALAAEKVAKEYETLGLVQGEHSRMLDSFTGEIHEAPFTTMNIVEVAEGIATNRKEEATHLSAQDIQVPQIDPLLKYESQPATKETRRILEEANKLPNPEKHAAIMLRQTVDYTVNGDHSTSETTRIRVYLAQESAADEWAHFQFYQHPPLETTRVESARIILPDATSLVINPAKLESTLEDSTSGTGSMISVLFPRVEAGSIVEIAWHTQRRGAYELPQFYQELPLQHSIPILQNNVTLKLPKGQKFHYKLAHIKGEPEVQETKHSNVLKWVFKDVPAFEPLPFDPPRRDFIAWLGVSSLDSWEDFISWFRRISKDSDKIGAAVIAKAKEIDSSNKTREEKIKGAFEFVSSLRYVAIEFGIHAFRPRTPEQVLQQRYGDCKDKANLLVALLRVMKIPASFVLLNRSSSTDKDFPGWQFNHAIAYVPERDGGGLWLDTTDTTTQFGTIAPGNLGRDALVFNGEKAEFITVSSASITAMHDKWIFTEFSDEKCAGNVNLIRTGLADYELRQQLRLLTPAQKNYFLIQFLSRLLPLADFKNVVVSDPMNLKNPMTISSEFEMPFPGIPQPDLKWLSAFSSGYRDRPIVINDGQKLEYEQIVLWPIISEAKSAGFTANTGGISLEIDFDKKEAATSRKAKLSINTSDNSTIDYCAGRSALREWLHLLNFNIHN